MRLIKPIYLRLTTFLLTVAMIVLTSQQVQSQTSQEIKIDGSSTVYPITQAVLEQFKTTTKKPVNVSLDVSGTGGGFRKFCAKETQINNASRPINAKEMEACNQAGVRFIELPVAFDALTVVVNKENNWIENITVAELKKIWQPEAQGKITRWQQVNSAWQDQPLNLFAPGKDSGTFEYFTEAIVGKSGASRTDYVASENDEILVDGVSKNPHALGYFGYAYYEKHQDKLKALGIDNGKGPVLPSVASVEKAQYQPLARPLFIYVDAKAAQDNQTIQEFVEFYLAKVSELVTSVGYIPLPEEGYHLGKIHFERGKVGTVFEGNSEFNLTIQELLRKQASF